jgi:hypothetical protein
MMFFFLWERKRIFPTHVVIAGKSRIEAAKAEKHKLSTIKIINANIFAEISSQIWS